MVIEYIDIEDKELRQYALFLAEWIRKEKAKTVEYDMDLHYLIDWGRSIPLPLAAFLAQRDKRIEELENVFCDVCNALKQKTYKRV